MSETSAASYDEMPYMRRAFTQTHPDRLATIARLFGVQSAAIDTCRVLELGCASGDNLIPMAVELPKAHFLGIDFSARQAEEGRECIAALRLENVELRQADIMEVDASYGHFDYIVCHGIYSWVPHTVREKVLAICRDNLAPHGVAYVSYNVLPGWYMRGMVRDMMLYHVAGPSTATMKVQQARALLGFLTQNALPNTAYRMVLGQELEAIAREPDSYVFHDHLEPTNEPIYFHQFVEAARRHRLQYLAEANFSQMLATHVSPQVADTLRRIAPDVVRMEQYIDFLRNRSFRQTLLVHEGVAIKRNVAAQALHGLYLDSPAAFESSSPSIAEGVVESFRAPNGAAIATSNAVTKAALMLLAARWPLGYMFKELLDAARLKLNRQSNSNAGAETLVRDTGILAGDMLHCYAADVVSLRASPPPITLTPGPCPKASPVARFQAERGLSITNLRHEPVHLDEFGSQLLRLLDGTRDREALVAAMAAATRAALRPGGVAGASVEDILRSTMDANLNKLARAALLMG